MIVARWLTHCCIVLLHDCYGICVWLSQAAAKEVERAAVQRLSRELENARLALGQAERNAESARLTAEETRLKERAMANQVRAACVPYLYIRHIRYIPTTSANRRHDRCVRARTHTCSHHHYNRHHLYHQPCRYHVVSIFDDDSLSGVLGQAMDHTLRKHATALMEVWRHEEK